MGGGDEGGGEGTRGEESLLLPRFPRRPNKTHLLLLHPVHGSPSLVDLPNLVGLPRVVEDALRGGGLPRVNVCHDTDVAVHA